MKGIIAGSVVLFLILLVGLTWVLGSRVKARLTAAYPPPGQMVDVGGYRLHINCQGESQPGGPTVVMEAGNGESSLTWAAVQPEVAKFARVCAYDRAGLGWSEKSPNPRTVADITDELAALLVADAGVEPPYVLVGHSISAGQLPISAGSGISASDVEQLKALIRGLPAELAALSPKGRQVVAEKSGHYIQVDQPELVIEAIREVVEAVQP
ncbi:MAG: alpha/beta fold hydrolase [Chloroflexi bacterium]|nr:alpha/beta fold hydrolase [Chloroflexota bacterium]